MKKASSILLSLILVASTNALAYSKNNLSFNISGQLPTHNFSSYSIDSYSKINYKDQKDVFSKSTFKASLTMNVNELLIFNYELGINAKDVAFNKYKLSNGYTIGLILKAFDNLHLTGKGGHLNIQKNETTAILNKNSSTDYYQYGGNLDFYLDTDTVLSIGYLESTAYNSKNKTDQKESFRHNNGLSSYANHIYDITTSFTRILDEDSLFHSVGIGAFYKASNIKQINDKEIEAGVYLSVGF